MYLRPLPSRMRSCSRVNSVPAGSPSTTRSTLAASRTSCLAALLRVQTSAACMSSSSALLRRRVSSCRGLLRSPWRPLTLSPHLCSRLRALSSLRPLRPPSRLHLLRPRPLHLPSSSQRRRLRHLLRLLLQAPRHPLRLLLQALHLRLISSSRLARTSPAHSACLSPTLTVHTSRLSPSRRTSR